VLQRHADQARDLQKDVQASLEPPTKLAVSALTVETPVPLPPGKPAVGTTETASSNRATQDVPTEPQVVHDSGRVTVTFQEAGMRLIRLGSVVGSAGFVGALVVARRTRRGASGWHVADGKAKSVACQACHVAGLPPVTPAPRRQRGDLHREAAQGVQGGDRKNRS